MALNPLPRSLPQQVRARGVTAVLGPTNTGKTHLAIERMLAYENGMIGLPLRLLAREVYNRVVERVGSDAVALITGEEKIKPPAARYWIATIEAMPRDLTVAFCAIDEIQLANHLERGHVFTDRLMNMRGQAETLIIGAATMRPLIEQLLPGANIVSRPRLSRLSYAGEKKITRLPRRSAIVAFSAEEVYAIAELIRRQHGGAAVVLGALSPRTRNAQVALYQSGDVDYVVATDAIGMGLNLDIDHVAFAANRKFDGYGFRPLNSAEIAQIAGRAGRHLKDGTFGTTGRTEAFDPETIEAVEDHQFEPVRILQWRNPVLDFRTLSNLQASLAVTPSEPGLTRAPVAEDVAALDILARDSTISDIAQGKSAVERLWDVCQVPDYRKVAAAAHADLVGTIFQSLMRFDFIADDWFARQIRHVDRTDGDIDTLSGRIAQVRTWTFVANRPDWLRDPDHWQSVTRQVEDRLSDALHERLASRFVDRRTSVLMRRLRENTMLEAEVTTTGDVLVEGQHVGRLQGFQFTPDAEAAGQADGQDIRALRNVAQKALAGEIETRAERLSNSADEAFVLANDGIIRWNGDSVGKLVEGESLLSPAVRLLADDSLAACAREKVEARLSTWLKAHVNKLLGSLNLLESAEDITGLARGIAFQIVESLGVLERSRVAQDIKTLDQDSRAMLRRHGVRFGAFHIYIPQLLKPAPRALAAQLWALKNGGLEQAGLDDIAHLASSGRTSFKLLQNVAKGLYRAAGFRLCGERVMRVDILERLADLIRPAVAYKPGITAGEPPEGTADGDGFVVTVSMTSLAGCAGEDFSSILKSLGYTSEKRTGSPITVALVEAPRLISTPASTETTDANASPQEQESDVIIFAESASDTIDGEAADLQVIAGPAVSTPDANASAEPGEIEIWHPHKHQHGPKHAHGDRRGRSGGQRNQQRPRQEDADSEQKTDRNSGEKREGQGRRNRNQNHERFGASPRSRNGGKTQGTNKPWQDRKGGASRADRAPDPDSPFAKLAALKQSLEGNKNK